MSSLAVLGFGNIGQTLCRQAVNTGLKIVAVADSSAAVISQKGFEIQQLNNLSAFKAKEKLANWNGTDGTVLSLSQLCAQLPEDSIVADCSASNETTKVLLDMQQRQMKVVLANKKPLTGSFSDYASLTSNRERIRFESTVGAGLPVICTIGRLMDSGDKILKIEGQLSGTLGFILSELQHGTESFSEIVTKAKQLGYTEPDPRDDLSGIDVARKSLIMARCIGMQVEMDDIEIESLYPKEMESLSLEQFMNSLGDLDAPMQAKISNATHNNNRLRYAAVITNQSIKVGLVEVSAGNALYHLSGTDNLISIRTEWYSSPLVIAGPGAGNDVTAAGVLSDVYALRANEKTYSTNCKL